MASTPRTRLDRILTTTSLVASAVLVLSIVGTIFGRALAGVMLPPVLGDGRLTGASLAVIVACGWASTHAAALRRGRARVVAIVGLVAGALTLLASVASILAVDLVESLVGEPEAFLRIVLLPGIGLFGTTGLAAMLHIARPRTPWAPWVRAAGLVTATLLGLMVGGLVPVVDLFGGWRGGPGLLTLSEDEVVMLVRLGVSLGLLTVSAAGILLVVERVRRLDADAAEVDRFDVRVRCPRCGATGELSSGGDHCRGCGLHIRIDAA